MMNNWIETNHELRKTFVFKTFQEAMEWMAKASVIVEKLNHHPTWTNEYNKVHVCLTTHDAGNTVTEKDRELARSMDFMEIHDRAK
jgi:4a-hydroxytetrahydrobiopterin dehydratase